MEQQRFKQQAMIQQSLYQHPALVAAPQVLIVPLSLSLCGLILVYMFVHFAGSKV
ncbi:hypothetical protein C1H46_044043 [Malus baccata]|uniref:Uncharacterized protein n=1 Tax=Malus baccata TaxID=106549 RepID=A0A540K865_MALBA|nr:hypothetical protein C1H46_044043 [Malus baccata]